MKYFLFLVFFPFCLSAQLLDLESKKLIEFNKTDHNNTLKLLEEIANINSGTHNIKGVSKVGELFIRELKSLGFKTEWISLPDSLKRAGHLVATREGTKGKKLFLIGHLDTVFEENMPFAPFKYLNDSTASGQGVSDMKGGDVMIIASLKALERLKLLDDRHITVYFTGDEESAGRPLSVSRKDFIDRAKSHDLALAYETTVAVNVATTARRGIGGWKLAVEGRQGHSAGVFNQMSGFGAIYEMSRILDTFRKEFSKEEYLTLNVGLIAGGSDLNQENEQLGVLGKSNIIARQASAIGDLRYLSKTQEAKTRARMREIVSTNNLHKTKASISFEEGIPAMPPSEKNNEVLKIFSQVSQDFGLGAVTACDPGLRGAGDIAYVADYLPCLDGLGAAGYGAHSPSETIDLKSYLSLIQRNTLFLYRLLK